MLEDNAIPLTAKKDIKIKLSKIFKVTDTNAIFIKAFVFFNTKWALIKTWLAEEKLKPTR